jgi:type II secretory pathway pseudopilin PulG
MRRKGQTAASRGFTLIEVLAAFIITLLMVGPLAALLSGAAGAMRGLGDSAARIASQGNAADAALALNPLGPGRFTSNGFIIDVVPDDPEASPGTGFRLLRVSVRAAAAPDIVLLEMLRTGAE